MKKPNTKDVVRVFDRLLNDDDGVCEKGFDALVSFFHELYEGDVPKELKALIEEVDAANGRFFLPANRWTEVE